MTVNVSFHSVTRLRAYPNMVEGKKPTIWVTIRAYEIKNGAEHLDKMGEITVFLDDYARAEALAEAINTAYAVGPGQPPPPFTPAAEETDLPPLRGDPVEF